MGRWPVSIQGMVTDHDGYIVFRTTARTSNLGVVLLGAGLFAVLTYALTSELFSRNSPTVLYGEACEKIKNAPRVDPPSTDVELDAISNILFATVDKISQSTTTFP